MCYRRALKVIAISDTAKVITDSHLEHCENIWINSDQIRRLNGIQSEPWSRILRKQCIPDRIAGSHWTWRPPLHSPWYTAVVPQCDIAHTSIFYLKLVLHWYSSTKWLSPCIRHVTLLYHSVYCIAHHSTTHFPYYTISYLQYYIHCLNYYMGSSPTLLYHSI